MSLKHFIKEDKINSDDLNLCRINTRLSLRKKNYDKIINNKRKLFSEIETLFPKDDFSSELPNNLMNINLFKILQNEQMLQIIMKIKGKFFDEDLTEVLQLVFSLDFNMNQNLVDTVNFINDNNIYIFLVDLLEQIIIKSQDNTNYNANNYPQIIFKILQILFKYSYSSDKENNDKLIEYINYKIYIFLNLFSYICNNQNVIKKTDIFLYLLNILFNLSIESNNLLNNLEKNKIPQKVVSIINDRKLNLKINDKNIYCVIKFLSLYLLDQKLINYDENYIKEIFIILNEKGITSSNEKVQNLSLYCLCNITSLYNSNNFYKKIICSNIFNNILQYIKKSTNINSIIVSLKIVNNILTEKNIDLNYFIKSDLLLCLMKLVINYKKNKIYISPDLLHHIISIFLYLLKSPLFYALIDKNYKLIHILIEFIGKISTQVTHDILTFIRSVINESYSISQLLIFNNKDLISKLIYLIRDESYNEKIRILALIILGKIFQYNNENDENMDDESNEDINLNIYKEQLKEIIELDLLNKNNINETLRKTYIIVLNIINEK